MSLYETKNQTLTFNREILIQKITIFTIPGVDQRHFVTQNFLVKRPLLVTFGKWSGKMNIRHSVFLLICFFLEYFCKQQGPFNDLKWYLFLNSNYLYLVNSGAKRNTLNPIASMSPFPLIWSTKPNINGSDFDANIFSHLFLSRL